MTQITFGTVVVKDDVLFYHQFVEKLFKNLGSPEADLNHGVIGCAGEVGELSDAIKKFTIYGKELDRNNVIEELGDLLFYMQAIMNKLQIPVSDVLQANADKLAKRYVTLEYSDAAAIARADKKEGE
jgi:NTP pyrophosphatase (non-canonical NTP hydrolase)